MNKKLALLFLPVSVAYAGKNIQMDKTPLICGSYTITKTTTPADITTNCQVISMKQKHHWFQKYLRIELYTKIRKIKKLSAFFQTINLKNVSLLNKLYCTLPIS